MAPFYKLFGVISLYTFFRGLGTVIAFSMLLIICTYYDLNRWKTFVVVAIVYIMAYAWMLLISWAASGFKKFGNGNFVHILIWIPVFVFLCSLLFRIKWEILCEVIAPCLVLLQAIAHIGCAFNGCCYGYETSGPLGIYNAHYDTYLFPIQILESLVALGITVYIIVKMLRVRFKTKGDLYPIMLILYGFTRFFLEFGRDNKKILLGISNLAINAIIAGIVGIVWLLTVRSRERKTIKKY